LPPSARSVFTASDINISRFSTSIAIHALSNDEEGTDATTNIASSFTDVPSNNRYSAIVLLMMLNETDQALIYTVQYVCKKKKVKQSRYTPWRPLGGEEV
jgi:hypothetical protein